MASLIFNSAIEDIANGNIDLGSDTFKVLLVTSSYSPNKDTHNRRDDVTNEVTGTGYSADGTSVTVTVTLDTATDRTDSVFAAVSWPSSTITARGAVYYKSRGGASSADELVMYNDFGSDFTSTNGTFSLSASTLRLQN